LFVTLLIALTREPLSRKSVIDLVQLSKTE